MTTRPDEPYYKQTRRSSREVVEEKETQTTTPAAASEAPLFRRASGCMWLCVRCVSVWARREYAENSKMPTNQPLTGRKANKKPKCRRWYLR